MSKEVNITLHNDDVQERLRQIIKSKHADIVSECMMDLLKGNDSAVQKLFKASMGLVPKIKYSVRDEVLVKVTGLYNYYMDKGKTETEGLSKNGLIPATIKTIDRFAHEPYHCSFRMWHKDKNHEVEGEVELRDTAIESLAEVFPGDDEKEGVNNDLPF